MPAVVISLRTDAVYFGSNLYSTCAISALVAALVGVSFPAFPPMVPVSTSSVMASFAQESILSGVSEVGEPRTGVTLRKLFRL